ncbi:unnamed protein product [Sphagnum jensenii]|uniref:N-acyl-aliphatic-L-amino acid amidohydrolase n=1 Tax=Sphagnum jensenii TaxID=128206 RepID=A0ABP1AT35_9BRYO
MYPRRSRRLFFFSGRFVPVLVALAVLFISTAAVLSYGTNKRGEEEEEEEHAAVLRRFRNYLQINTAHPSPDYKSAVEFLLSQASEIGLDSRVLEFVEGKPLVLLTWKGEDPSISSILLNSHTDVVPAEREKWLHDPFAAVQDAEGNIFARGAQDMKCVSMQYLEAIRNLKSKSFQPLRTLHLSFVPDEEVGGIDGAGKFVSSPEFQKLNIGFSLDEGIISLGDTYKVFNGERSLWWLKIKATGAPGHGSKLYDGSALGNLLKSLELINKFREEQFNLVKSGEKAEAEVTSINCVYLKAGTPTPMGFVMNLQPSEAEAGFDIRVTPQEDVKELQRILDEEWAPASRNLTYTFSMKENPLDKDGQLALTVGDDSNPWFVLLKEAVAKAGGKLDKVEIFPAVTDLRYIRHVGIPGFGFSPLANTPLLAHGHNEFLNAGEFLKGIGVYEEIIKAYTSFPPPADSETRAEL